MLRFHARRLLLATLVLGPILATGLLIAEPAAPASDRTPPMVETEAEADTEHGLGRFADALPSARADAQRTRTDLGWPFFSFRRPGGP